MSIKSILLHVSDIKGSVAAESLAIDLAGKFEAHVIALGLAAKPQITGYVDHPLVVEAMETQGVEVIKQTQDQVNQFVAKAEAAGVRAEGRIESCSFPEMEQKLLVHARYCDLLVMPQAESGPLGMEDRSLIQDVVLTVGRPILAVPHACARQSCGDRVVVGWNASREATRAVTDALPLLSRAQSVTVLTVEPERSISAHGAEPGTDIAGYLARHGCAVEVDRIEATDVAVGQAIQNRVRDLNADLLVMGAYGHSKLREFVFGGATRHLLENSTVPLLIAH